MCTKFNLSKKTHFVDVLYNNQSKQSIRRKASLQVCESGIRMVVIKSKVSISQAIVPQPINKTEVFSYPVLIPCFIYILNNYLI